MCNTMSPEDSPDNAAGSSDGSADQSPEVPLSLDAVLEILANERRRYLLEYLWEQPGDVESFEAVTEHTVTELRRKRGCQPDRTDIRIGLQQHHLPKLADAGVIEYDVRSQTIRYRGDERLEALYERIREFERE